jgi:hypothetical protein
MVRIFDQAEEDAPIRGAKNNAAGRMFNVNAAVGDVRLLVAVIVWLA